MLYAVFRGHEAFVVLAALLSAAVGAVVRVRAPGGPERRWLKGLFAASVTAVLSLTLWSTGSPAQRARLCVVDRDLVQPFFTDQGLLNAGLFLPVGLLGALATRKILGTIAFGVLLTLTIETLQATLTFLGRGCDTSDLEMNAVGAAAGALAGWALTAFTTPRAGFLHRWAPRGTYAVVSTAVVLALAWALAIEPQVVSHTAGLARATAEQERAIESAVAEAFDGHYEISRVEFVYGPDDVGVVMAWFAGGGSAELRWPDRALFKAYVEMTDTGKPTGYPVPGTRPSPADARQAQAVALAYATRHAPWALRSSRPATERTELGWTTTWRRLDANGVRMPMRLDIQLDRLGRLTQFVMSDLPDPRVPAPRIPKDAAVAAFLHTQGPSATPPPGSTVTAELRATGTNGRWIPAWYVEIEGPQPAVGWIDALTGTPAAAAEWS